MPISRILELYPETKVVGNVKTMQMISQFFDADLEGRQVVVKEGDWNLEIIPFIL